MEYTSYIQLDDTIANRTPANTQDHFVDCKWDALRLHLMLQWETLTAAELDRIGPVRSRIAALIERKYGIASHLVENYLSNFERALPLAA